MVSAVVKSLHIGQKAAQSIYYAVGEHAERIGHPLSYVITINFALTKIDPREAVVCFQRLRRDFFNKWATRPRKGAGEAFPPTYAYSFENVRGDVVFETMNPGDPHNVHVHWLAHLPASRMHDFEGVLWNWLEAVAGPFELGAIDIQPLDDVKGWRSYMLKGTCKPWGQLYCKHYKPQGIIIGRRASTSLNLGPTSRKAMDRAKGVCRRIPARPHPSGVSQTL